MKPIRTIAVASLLAVALTGAAWATTMDDQKELSAQAIGMWGDASLMDRIGDTLADGYMNHQVPDVNGGTQTIDEAAWIELLDGFPPILFRRLGRNPATDRRGRPGGDALALHRDADRHLSGACPDGRDD